MSEFATINGSHIAGGAFLLGLILYFWWKNKLRRDDIELRRRFNEKSVYDPADKGDYDLRTRVRGSRSWIS